MKKSFPLFDINIFPHKEVLTKNLMFCAARSEPSIALAIDEIIGVKSGFRSTGDASLHKAIKDVLYNGELIVPLINFQKTAEYLLKGTDFSTKDLNEQIEKTANKKEEPGD